MLQEVLDEMLKLNKGDLQNKGIILVLDSMGKSIILAQKGFDQLNADLYFNEKVDSIIGEEKSIILPIEENNEVFGSIILFEGHEQTVDSNLLDYLEAISSIIARRISLQKRNDDLRQKSQEIIAKEKILRMTLTDLQYSIDHAKLIQTSLIPGQKILDKIFDDGAALFIPKDQVSGDFYFAHTIDNLTYFGIGDCTGHGIPGAFIANMSIEALRLGIYQSPGLRPNKILHDLREIALDRFINDPENLSDSMDAAICLLDKNSQTLYFSGGFMNVLIIRDNKELIEIKGTKSPIGSYPIKLPFELHSTQIQKGDTIYITSDGYYDQFGSAEASPLNKSTKFKKYRFKDLIMKNSHLPSKEQIKILHSSFVNWKGKNDQTDDVSVMIVKH